MLCKDNSIYRERAAITAILVAIFNNLKVGVGLTYRHLTMHYANDVGIKKTKKTTTLVPIVVLSKVAKYMNNEMS